MSATLAIDLGGTKTLAALVDGPHVVARAERPTRRDGDTDHWLADIADLVAGWRGSWGAAGATVTGLVAEGRWRALNLQTLRLDAWFPLAQRLTDLLGQEPVLANDGQAAAWGEYRHGAGRGRDMVYLTVSTGIGGGIVAGGRLLRGRSGLAGHVGLLVDPLSEGDVPFEDHASGRFLAATAGLTDARAVFADAGAEAEEAIALSARRVARLCRNLQLLLDPEVIVLGGGVGLAPGYLDRVEAELGALDAIRRPTLAPAALGPDSGAIGIAALATDPTPTRETQTCD